MPSSPIVLRLAGSQDAELIARMHADSWAATYRGLLPDGFLDTGLADERRVHWQSRMREAVPQAVYIAERGGEPIGFACVRDEGDPRGVLLDNLHVLGPFQGAGAGRMLVEQAARWARARGAKQLYLYAIEGNRRAIGFYERQGWRLAATEEDELGGLRVQARRYVRPV
ncbi:MULTISPECIES: GNAT family N-acetyltransferase [unclassified Achromobacter]|uniref:GNAT family N-acetyltransferase n=1 Tax=unclassified Achromobacter TaxID=2626865 RepID=UPI00069DAEE6|nr:MULTISPECIES: GNAT family N-acetyltransferase [unclassified Achromobacter]KOF55565.1 acetyltransferase [Achromobacter sp. DMS1]